MGMKVWQKCIFPSEQKKKKKKKRRKSASSDLIARAGALVIPQLLFIHVVWSDCDTTLGGRNITLDG